MTSCYRDQPFLLNLETETKTAHLGVHD